MEPTLIVYPSKRTLAEAVAQRTLLAILDDFGVEPDRKRLDIALTGGSDTIAALKDMAGNPLVRVIDWPRVHIWWADERFVATDDSDRNVLQARRMLLDELVHDRLMPENNIHPMPADGRRGSARLRPAQPAQAVQGRSTAAARNQPTEMSQAQSTDLRQDRRTAARLARSAGAEQELPVQATESQDLTATPESVERLTQNRQGTDAILDRAAREYERNLTTELGDEPAFDLALLGMGPDGHYASLFPGHREITVTDRVAVGVSNSPKQPPLRLSLTAPVLARTRRTWFLTAGDGKADALAHVFALPNNPEYPASFGNGTKEYIWFTDPAAAGHIRDI